MKKGFTLAEVLITLGVIGVVSAITMPTLVQKHQEQATVVKLKKIYSTISQGYMRAVQENESPDNWDIGTKATTDASLNFIEKLKPYFKIVKTCEYDGDCFAPKFSQTNGRILSPFKDRAYGVLADGTSFALYVYSEDCTSSMSTTDTRLQNICAEIKVDINGLSNPNMYGKDMFNLLLTKNNVIPEGMESQDSGSTFTEQCNLSSETNTGDGCTAWVIYNGNMDYLHCNDLSWDGKTKCK